MPLDMLEDDAELGALIGLSPVVGGQSCDCPSDLGAQLALGEYAQGDVGWGFARRLARRTRRLVKKGTRAVRRSSKRIGKRALRLAKRGLRHVKDIALLPLKYQWKLIRRFMLPLAKQYCRLPKHIRLMGAKAADVDPRLMKAFCIAVKESGKKGSIKKRAAKRLKKLMPVALKVAVKLAVQGQFPAAVPIIRSLKLVPGISKLPGMSYLAGDLYQFDTLGAELLVSGAQAVPGGELLVIDPMAMFDELEDDELTTMDGDLEDPLGWEYLREDSPYADSMGAYHDGTGACGESDCY